MAHLNKPFDDSSDSPSVPSTFLSEQSQLDFELEFFTAVLQCSPEYVDVLRQMSKLLTLKGRYEEGLTVDRRLVQLCSHDPYAHYNLACRYGRLKRGEECLRSLRRAIDLGYDDFRYMLEDRDLDSVRHDPRFLQMIQDHHQSRER